MSSISLGDQILTYKSLDNKLKHLDVLKDTLMPFLLIIDTNGIILSAGKAINKIAGKNIESIHIDEIVSFIKPKSFKKLKELKENSLKENFQV